MNMTHTVRIHVAKPDGNHQIIQSGIRHLPRRLIRFLFGDCSEILVLKPGETGRDRKDRRDQRNEGRRQF